MRAAGGKLIGSDYTKDSTVYVCWPYFLHVMALPDLSVKKLADSPEMNECLHVAVKINTYVYPQKARQTCDRRNADHACKRHSYFQGIFPLLALAEGR